MRKALHAEREYIPAALPEYGNRPFLIWQVRKALHAEREYIRRRHGLDGGDGAAPDSPKADAALSEVREIREREEHFLASTTVTNCY